MLAATQGEELRRVGRHPGVAGGGRDTRCRADLYGTDRIRVDADKPGARSQAHQGHTRYNRRSIRSPIGLGRLKTCLDHLTPQVLAETDILPHVQNCDFSLPLYEG